MRKCLLNDSFRALKHRKRWQLRTPNGAAACLRMHPAKPIMWQRTRDCAPRDASAGQIAQIVGRLSQRIRRLCAARFISSGFGAVSGISFPMTSIGQDARSGRTGEEIHLPRICAPQSGWVFVRANLPDAAGPSDVGTPVRTDRGSAYDLIASVRVSNSTIRISLLGSSTTATPRPKSSATIRFAAYFALMPFSRMVCRISGTV